MVIEVKVVGFDIAKNVFQVHGVDRRSGGIGGQFSRARSAVDRAATRYTRSRN
jgi:hypothetical protein